MEIYVGCPTIFFSYFYLQFLGRHILQINILAINRCIHTGDTKGRGRRWPGWVPRRGNSQGKNFPQISILPNIIDGEGCLGGQGSCVIGKEKSIPMDGHFPGQDLMAGSALGKPRGAA